MIQGQHVFPTFCGARCAVLRVSGQTAKLWDPFGAVGNPAEFPKLVKKEKHQRNGPAPILSRS